MNTLSRKHFLGLFVASALVAVAGTITFGKGSASALPACLDTIANRNARISDISSTFPRSNLSVNNAGCGGVSSANSAVLISSYYYDDANHFSTLHTPYAIFTTFYRSATAPPAQVVTINKHAMGGRCAWAGTGDEVKVSSFLGSGIPTTAGYLDSASSQSVTIPGSDFVLDPAYGTNVWRSTRYVQVEAKQGIFNSISCPVYATVAGGGVITFTEDSFPTTGFGEPEQRYNMQNWNTATVPPKKALGPRGAPFNTSPTGAAGAFALYSDLSATLEYGINFQLKCGAGAATYHLRVYDGDSQSAQVAPPGGKPNPLQATDIRTVLYNDNDNSQVLADQAVVSSNDEYVEYAVNLQPNTKYSWVFYNVIAKNGIQIWMPSSEVLGGGSCIMGTCTINNIVSALTGSSTIYPGDPIRFDVVTSGVPGGRQLGVNGSSYGGGTANGEYINYLMAAGNYLARGSPNGVGIVTAGGAEGTLPSSGTTMMDDIMLGTSGDGNITATYAPGAPGVYPFNWGLVNPNVNWQPQIGCAGQVNVQPKPQVTISGHLFDADYMPINYGGIAIVTCVPVGTTGYVPPVTDGNGNYSFQVPIDTPFCIRANSWPTYATNAWVRPSAGESYLGCGGPFGAGYATPNYCPGYGTYEYQSSGGFHNQPGIPGVPANIDRSTDAGYDIVFRIAKTTISGTLYNAYNLTQKYAGVVLDTCVPGDGGAAAVTATSNAAGAYSFPVRMGGGFCIRPNAASSGGNWPSNYYNVRPWNEGYWVCPGYTGATSSPNYCVSAGTYECQQSIDNVGPLSCGGSPVADFDRAADSGYDFAFRFPPSVSCTVSLSTATVETGVPFDLTMTGRDAINAFRPPVSSGTYTYDVSGQGGGTGALPPLVPRGKDVTVANRTYTINTSGNYPITAYVNATGDGIPTGRVDCSGPLTVAAASHPYFRVYGADTVTGSGFSTTGPTPSCVSTATNIYAFAQKDIPGPSINYKGAGTQYGAIASGNILGFFTASNRQVVDTPPKSLSFANTTAVDEYGGNYGLGTPCITDYYSDPANVPAPVNGGTRDLSLTSANGGETAWGGAVAANLGKHRYLANANTTINGLTIPVGTEAAIYVDGDLTISNDITLAGGAGTIATMPNLSIIVRGNIFITPNVRRIDGLYVAQPRVGQEASKGRIYTCALAFAQVPAVNLATTCGTGSNPLAINGSLVAQQVKFLRTQNSVKDSIYSTVLPAGEVPNFADGSGTGGGANTKAAEVINYTPEMYIAPSAIKNPDLACVDVTCKYDSIFSLPPVY